MKKMFLVLFATGAISVAFAQDGRYSSDRDNGREIVLGDNDQHTAYGRTLPHPDDRTLIDRRKWEEINKINRNYDRRLQAVEEDRRLRRREKAREISRLQREKEAAIHELNVRFEKYEKHRRY